jgi:hypothetical protein
MWHGPSVWPFGHPNGLIQFICPDESESRLWFTARIWPTGSIGEFFSFLYMRVFLCSTEWPFAPCACRHVPFHLPAGKWNEKSFETASSSLGESHRHRINSGRLLPSREVTTTSTFNNIKLVTCDISHKRSARRQYSKHINLSKYMFRLLDIQ